jgi:CheY-like chemotaxis protein
MNALRESIADEALIVLVVDELGAKSSVLSQTVLQLGHRVVRACGGDEAVMQFQACAPDLVLMDVRMPSTDGLRATERVRKLQGSRWVPVIYVTAQDSEGGIIAAIEAGGDDCLTKPITADLLRAKLRGAARILSLQRENARRNAELERYFHNAEEEQKIAGSLMHRLVQMDMICDRAVEHRLTPALHLSGDVIAAARTPDDTLHVLLADGTGHGLAASLGVMPVVQPFYAMTQKGFSLTAIAKEVNRKVREWLPVGRFIATTLIEVDPYARIVSVWNGGNPPAIVLDEDGAELHRFVSQHLPLGIVRSREMDLTFDRITLDCEAQLIACSDGVIEAVSPDGTQFGIYGVIAAAQSAQQASRMSALNAALDAHLAGRKPHDDLSVVVIDCGDPQVDAKQGAGDVHSGVGTRGLRKWRFEVELTPDELRGTDVVPMVMATLERTAVPVAHRGNLFVVLSELFNNALDHGLLLLDSKLKSGPRGMERYLTLRAERLESLSMGWIRLGLTTIDRDGELRLQIHMHDSGDGFDWQVQSAGGRQEDLHGRGISLLHRLCERIEYRGSGSEVVGIYKLGPRT